MINGLFLSDFYTIFPAPNSDELIEFCNEKSKLEESFVNDMLEYPHYTKPRVWNNLSVPEVLLSGNHKEIRKWRSEKALYFTKKIMKKNKKNDS